MTQSKSSMHKYRSKRNVGFDSANIQYRIVLPHETLKSETTIYILYTILDTLSTNIAPEDFYLATPSEADLKADLNHSHSWQ